jgi:hypothetical protein
MLNRVIFVLLLLATVASYAYAYDDVTFGMVGIYNIASACLMFFGMYAGSFGKYIPRQWVKFILINTLVSAVVGVYQELNTNLDLMTHLELLSYATFIVVYYGLSFRLVRLIPNGD